MLLHTGLGLCHTQRCHYGGKGSLVPLLQSFWCGHKISRSCGSRLFTRVIGNNRGLLLAKVTAKAWIYAVGFVEESSKVVGSTYYSAEAQSRQMGAGPELTCANSQLGGMVSTTSTTSTLTLMGWAPCPLPPAFQFVCAWAINGPVHLCSTCLVPSAIHVTGSIKS